MDAMLMCPHGGFRGECHRQECLDQWAVEDIVDAPELIAEPAPAVPTVVLWWRRLRQLLS